MKKAMFVTAAVIAALIAGAMLFVGVGIYDVAADTRHSRPVYWLLETARDRSIAVRAEDIDVPALDDPASARRGAGNYDSMCKGCHLAPGEDESELSVGLYPAPPNLAKHAHVDPAEAFWVIKHGIKATGMPAWGRRMEDKYVWDLVAFLRQLPKLSPEQYAAAVAASGGHSHGGGESTSGDGVTDEASHDHPTEAGDGESMGAATHTHADGKQHEHERIPAAPVAAAKALHAALSSGDAMRVRELLDAQVLIFEGGNVERSREEYASHHLPSDLKFMKSVKYELVRQSGDAVGDLAWVASEARMTGDIEGKEVDLGSTETLVLRKGASGWKVIHIHWSSRDRKKR